MRLAAPEVCKPGQPPSDVGGGNHGRGPEHALAVHRQFNRQDATVVGDSIVESHKLATSPEKMTLSMEGIDKPVKSRTRPAVADSCQKADA